MSENRHLSSTSLVYTQEISCVYTKESLVYTQEILCMHNTFVHTQKNSLVYTQEIRGEGVGPVQRPFWVPGTRDLLGIHKRIVLGMHKSVVHAREISCVYTRESCVCTRDIFYVDYARK